MATPEWFAKLKRRTAEIIDFENDALERDMVRTQESESEKGESEEDMYRRIRLEQEKREEAEIAERMHEWNKRNVSKVSRGVYCVLCVLICVTMIALLTAVFEVLGLLLCAAKAEGAWDTQAVRLCMVMAPLGLLTTLALPRLLPMDSLVMALTNLLPMPPTVKMVSTTMEPVMIYAICGPA